MYDKKELYTDLKELMKLIVMRKNGAKESNREGLAFLFDLCNNAFIKMNYNIRFVNEDNEKQMRICHSQIISDLTYLLNNGTYNIQKFIKAD